jgi:SAM-dependent methyltransferase
VILNQPIFTKLITNTLAIKYDITTHLDDPDTTVKHREIILSKVFLKKIYTKWYADFVNKIPGLPAGKLLEIGSGGGFLKELIPELITSDIMPLDHCDMIISAEEMPFEKNELSGIFMLNVFHHIPKPYLFLKEAERTLKPGGKIIMIEPANSAFGRWIYKTFHHEPFDIKGDWEIASSGPLSGSNQALPHIYFERDRKKFEQQFTQLKIQSINYHTPVLYLLSGGVSRKALMPVWAFPFWNFIEKMLHPIRRQLGMFQTIEILKIEK